MKEISPSESIGLTRIHAIQWYGFCDSFDLAGQTIITGVYGCGKTGLIDLIQTVLLGPPEHGNRYNLSLADIGSSSREEKRDLRGYCLQDLNLDTHGQRVFARRSSRTYIALEFTWPDHQRRETWGLRIEYASTGADPTITYWKVLTRLDFEDFLGKNEVPKSSEEWEGVLEERKERVFPSKAEYLEALSAAQHLNFNPRVFEPLLLQTLQFKFGKDFTEFCRNNILPEDPIPLEEVRGSYDRYRDLLTKIHHLQHQKEVLKRIQEAFEEQKRIVEEIAALRWFQRKCTLEEAKSAWEAAETRWRVLRDAAKAWHERQNELHEQKEDAERQLAGGLELMRSKPNAGDFADLKKQQRALPREIAELQTTLGDPVAAFRDKFDRVHRLWASGREALRRYGWAEPAGLPELTAELPARLNADELGERINKLILILDPLTTHFNELARPAERDLGLLEDRMIRLRGEISRVKDAKTAEALPLHEALAEQLGPQAVELLGNLCTILDEEWTDALEINFGHKFSSVVADAKIERAFGIFNGLSHADGRERLLCRNDMRALPGTARPGSLAEKITSDDPAVRQLLAHLFGEVKCCRTISQAEAEPRSMLPSGAVKQPTGRRRLRAAPAEYVIGERGRQRMLSRKEQEKRELEAEIDAAKLRAEAARGPANGFQSIKNGLLQFSANKVKLLRDLDGKRKAQDDAIRRLNLFENREQLERLQTEIDAHDRTTEEIAKRIREHHEKEPSEALESERQAIALKQSYEDEEFSWLTWLKEHPDELDAASRHPDLKEEIARETMPARPASTACELISSQRGRRVAEVQGELRVDRLNLKQDPRFTDYRDIDEKDFESNTYLDKKLAYIRDTGLDELEDKAEQAEAEWEDRFQNQVLGQLDHKLGEIYETFRALRRITADRLIGGSSYNFTHQAVDGAHFELLRRLAADREVDNLLPVGDPRHVEIRRERRMAMESLTLPPPKAGDDAARLRATAVRVRELLDARYYFTYDMEIVEPGRTEKISLARRGRRGSGGETYIPYFIALTTAYLRAFQRHVNKGRPSISLLIMDEAFKVLSGEAVRDCVRIARELGLQSVISCTDTNAGQIVELFQWIMLVQKRVTAGAGTDGHDLIENTILSVARNDPEVNRLLVDFVPDAPT